jgi:hypothetical protein
VSWTEADKGRLSVEIIKDFIAIDPETQPRNVIAWTPVVTDILKGCCGFEKSAVSTCTCLKGGGKRV